MSTTPEYMPWEEQSLKTKLFTFHGRLSRRHYIYLTILTWVLAGAISYLLHTASATLGTMTGGICLIVAVILAIPTTIISLSIAVRRWHDLNKSWQYVLINVCCAFAGDRGFTHPELNAYALRKLRPQIEANGIQIGYCNSRTCEIGLTTNSGIPYVSIAYLVDECTEPVGKENGGETA